MSLNLAIDNETETITTDNVAPYMDTATSAHYWGNSRPTQFGLTRLFETSLEEYINNTHTKIIKNSML